MTCIVGFVEGETIYMGADSAGVGGYDIRTRKDPKVFMNGEFIMGYTTSFRMGQILRYSLNVTKKTEGQDDYEYMCTTFIDAVIRCFKDKGFAKVSDGVARGGNFLVGYNKKLYYVEADYQVGIPNMNYESCGCGEDYALGAMHMIAKDEGFTPKQKIIKALETAQEFSAGVRGPFNIISMKNKK